MPSPLLPARSRSRPTPVRIDLLVLACTLIWGLNYAVVKIGLREIPYMGFNALRLGIASTLFLAVLAFAPANASGDDRGPRGRRLFPSARGISARDWLTIAALGATGHFLYQLGFIGGLALTSVANSSLIMGCSPVVVTALAAAAGQEHVSRGYWAGAVLSLAGIYLVVGAGAGVSRDTLVGDLVTLGAVACWAVYVVWSRTLMRRHSPLAVTGYTMAAGTLMYLPFGYPSLAALDWGRVSATAWLALVASAVFALFVAYLIWHTSIQRIGNVRTAMYSNLTPILALTTGVLFFGDRMGPREVGGAVAILIGVGVARVASTDPASVPAEE